VQLIGLQCKGEVTCVPLHVFENIFVILIYLIALWVWVYEGLMSLV
jgi:hypothetical protein